MVLIGDQVEAELLELRAQAESLMVDTVRVERKSGSTMDPTTLEMVDDWSLIYAGPCRLLPVNVAGVKEAAGDTSFAVADARIATPITADSGAIRNGDRATITAVGVVGDPADVGRVFTLTRDPSRSHRVERRFSCQEVS